MIIKRMILAVALVVALKFGADWVVNYVPAGIKGASPDFLTDIEPTSLPTARVATATAMVNCVDSSGGVTCTETAMPNCADPGLHLSYDATAHTFDCGISQETR